MPPLGKTVGAGASGGVTAGGDWRRRSSCGNVTWACNSPVCVGDAADRGCGVVLARGCGVGWTLTTRSCPLAGAVVVGAGAAPCGWAEACAGCEAGEADSGVAGSGGGFASCWGALTGSAGGCVAAALARCSSAPDSATSRGINFGAGAWAETWPRLGMTSRVPPKGEVPPVAVPLPMLDPEPSVVPGVGAS